MCRLIAIIGENSEHEIEYALQGFGTLAAIGNVPPETEWGHGDGWGLAAYKNGRISFLEKDPSSAFANLKYAAATARAGKLNPALILGHLRKASIGEKKAENTGPYSFDPYTLCHNGTVRDYQTLPLEPKYAASRHGETDSEWIFLWLVQTIQKNGGFLEGFLKGIKKIRTMDYTALNILISDGKMLLATREVNENNEEVKQYDLCRDYYTLLQGKNASGITKFVCSQKIRLPYIVWTEIPNHAALVVDLATGKDELVRI